MFVGVGVGAYVSGMFHLVTHAFFKASFCSSALRLVIHAMHRAYHTTHRDEDAQDMANMGGLRRYLPVTYVLMWIATSAISRAAARRLLLQGRDPWICIRPPLRGRRSPPRAGLDSGSTLLYSIYVIGLITALLTAIYMTRMMLTLHGPNRTGAEESSHLHDDGS